MKGPRPLDIERLRIVLGTARDPHGWAFAPLADALRLAGRLEEASEVVRAGTAASPDFASGHVVAAWVFRAMGDVGASDAHMRRALELDPGNARALESLAQLAEDRGDLDEASTLLRRLVQAEPWNSWAQESIARVEARLSPVDPSRPAKPRDSGTVGLSAEAEAVSPTDSPSARPDEVVSGSPTPAADPVAPPLPVRDADDAALTGSSPTPAARSPRRPDDVSPATELTTRTMAELFVAQGMIDRAMDVLERLIEREPADDRLRLRLEEVRAMAVDGGKRSEEAGAALTEAPTSNGPASAPPSARAGETTSGVPRATHEVDPDVGGPVRGEPIDSVPGRGREYPGETVGEYFDAIFGDRAAVPTPSRATEGRDREPELGSDAEGEHGPKTAIPIARLGPDSVPIEALAPKVVPIASLAPESEDRIDTRSRPADRRGQEAGEDTEEGRPPTEGGE